MIVMFLKKGYPEMWYEKTRPKARLCCKIQSRHPNDSVDGGLLVSWGFWVTTAIDEGYLFPR